MTGFSSCEIETGETHIFVRIGGEGPPILLLHGFPQTHVMWRAVAQRLARDFTVVCADLRGYGRSGCPVSAPDHAPYAKRAMAEDMATVMERLGFPRFSIAGHDRGGCVACRLGLDHPRRVDRLAVLDIVPTEAVWERADARFALAFWPWSLLAQPEPLPERILTLAADVIVNHAVGEWGSRPAVFAPEARAAYVDALRDPAHAHAITASQAARPGSPPSLWRVSGWTAIVSPGGSVCHPHDARCFSASALDRVEARSDSNRLMAAR